MPRPPASLPGRIVAVTLPVAWAALIFSGSSSEAPSVLTDLQIPDKLLHFVEYAVLGLLVSRASLFLTGCSGWAALVIVPAVIAAVYGASDEIHQMSVPAREADFADAVADLVGGLAGAWLYRWWLLQRVEDPAPEGD